MEIEDFAETVICANEEEVESVATAVRAEGFFSPKRDETLSSPSAAREIRRTPWQAVHEHYQLPGQQPVAPMLSDLNLIALRLNLRLNEVFSDDVALHGKCIAVTLVERYLVIGTNGAYPDRVLEAITYQLTQMATDRGFLVGLKHPTVTAWWKQSPRMFVLAPGWMQYTHAELRLLQWMLCNDTLKNSRCCGYVGVSLPLCPKCSYIYHEYNRWAQRKLFEKLSTREGHDEIRDNWEFGSFPGEQCHLNKFVEFLDELHLDILNVLDESNVQ